MTDATNSSDHCTVCGNELTHPLPNHANYAISEAFGEKEEVEVYYGFYHTDFTKAEVNRVAEHLDRDKQAIAAEMAAPDAPDTITVTVGTREVTTEDGETFETTETEDIDFSIPVEKFNRVEVSSPQDAGSGNIAYVETTTEMRDVAKTATVCPGCTPEEAEILWGVDE